MSLIYKILSAEAWRAARDAGVFAGATIDLQDGYIHFSTAGQAQETARRYFSGTGDLVVLTVDADRLGEGLKWEPSRGGDLFPHLYGSLPVALVEMAAEVVRDADGVPMLGDLASERGG
jgi:uncharacterized protein (DUF952 family)